MNLVQPPLTRFLFRKIEELVKEEVIEGIVRSKWRQISAHDCSRLSIHTLAAAGPTAAAAPAAWPILVDLSFHFLFRLILYDHHFFPTKWFPCNSKREREKYRK